jgi:hypothetical protein
MSGRIRAPCAWVVAEGSVGRSATIRRLRALLFHLFLRLFFHSSRAGQSCGFLLLRSSAGHGRAHRPRGGHGAGVVLGRGFPSLVPPALRHRRAASRPRRQGVPLRPRSRGRGRRGLRRRRRPPLLPPPLPRRRRARPHSQGDQVDAVAVPSWDESIWVSG